MTPGNGPPISLQRPVILIGRHPECDVRLDLPQVSRRHCCVAQAYDRLTIRDLGSRNGVRVNGRRVEETGLQPGDEVAIAHVLYRLVAAEEAGRGRPTAVPPRPEPAPDRPASDGLGIDLIPLDD